MNRLGARTLPSLVVMVVVAACGAASTSPSPIPAAASPGAISPLATPVPPSHSSAPPTPAAGRTGAPTSAALDLGGTWVMPKAGARLTSYTTTLSARPTATGPGVTTFTKVVFSGTWAGAEKSVMCKATRPANSGAWSCRANLLALGVPPGKVTFSFDVYGEGVPVVRSPDGSRRVTYAVPPAEADRHTMEEHRDTRGQATGKSISHLPPALVRACRLCRRLPRLQHLGVPSRLEEERRHAVLRLGHVRRCPHGSSSSPRLPAMPARSRFRLTPVRVRPLFTARSCCVLATPTAGAHSRSSRRHVGARPQRHGLLTPQAPPLA